jgi:N-acetylglucosaminyldiphosphoundecaprenol N-acetyl-beta-D-mannosaminyltransferase
LTNTANIIGIPVTRATSEEVLENVASRIHARLSGGYISITNTETMYYARRSPDLLQYVQSAQLSLCDGIGVVLAGLFWGERIKRYTGPQFQLDCTARGAAAGWRHFYYGGKEGVADELARRLAEQYPGSVCVGTYAPPFRELTETEDAEVVEMINRAQPDIVWVGLGLPKQERWIAAHLGRINAAWMVGVGAAFDYHSGAVRRAPAWARAIGTEWIFRLVREPRLRAKRYWNAFVFVCEAAVRSLARMLPGSPPTKVLDG